MLLHCECGGLLHALCLLEPPSQAACIKLWAMEAPLEVHQTAAVQQQEPREHYMGEVTISCTGRRRHSLTVEGESCERGVLSQGACPPCRDTVKIHTMRKQTEGTGAQVAKQLLHPPPRMARCPALCCKEAAAGSTQETMHLPLSASTDVVVIALQTTMRETGAAAGVESPPPVYM